MSWNSGPNWSKLGSFVGKHHISGFSPDPLDMGGQVQGDKVLMGGTHEGDS